MLIEALFIIARVQKQPKCPSTKQWITIYTIYMCVYHTYNGILLSHKKNEILPFVVTWMDLEGIVLEWNKLDREKQILYKITYMWNLKNTI